MTLQVCRSHNDNMIYFATGPLVQNVAALLEMLHMWYLGLFIIHIYPSSTMISDMAYRNLCEINILLCLCRSFAILTCTPLRIQDSLIIVMLLSWFFSKLLFSVLSSHCGHKTLHACRSHNDINKSYNGPANAWFPYMTRSSAYVIYWYINHSYVPSLDYGFWYVFP